MFTYLKIQNYRSLNNVFFDLKEKQNKAKKLAVIYGENGSGKTNLVSAFYFLKALANSFLLEQIGDPIDKMIEEGTLGKIPDYYLDQIKVFSLKYITERAKPIGVNKNTRLEFGFIINNHEGYYIVEFNDKIVYEKLYYFTGKISGTIYEIKIDDIKNPTLSNLIFKTSKIKKEMNENINKYFGKHSFLGIITNLMSNINEDYIKENISSYLFDFINMIKDTNVGIKGEVNLNKGLSSFNNLDFISGNLKKGEIDLKDEHILNKTEKILDEFFIQAYADIKKVTYEKEYEENKIKYHLIFHKLINNKITLVPIEEESSGTLKILSILGDLFETFYNKDVVIDEIDDGIHDLLLKVIIDSMKGNITGQLIFTTHNTTLLESLKPYETYIIDGNYNGEKEIICLDDYKLQDHNSLRLRYMKGLFGGVPLVDEIDYSTIIKDLKRN